MIRAALLATTLTLALPAGAQDAMRLADLRAELADLSAQLQALRSELVASGMAGFQAAGGDTALDRMNMMETAIARLTGQTEQLQARINRVASDGARRIGDIEFRLCEMDETCDLGALMSQPDLGAQAQSGVISVSPSRPAHSPDDKSEAAISTQEQAAFDAAHAALKRGEFLQAADKFAALAETHAGGPLTAEALFLRGTALDAAGQPAGAAEAWLEGFAADPNGARAGETLLGLSRLAQQSGDVSMACLYLGEIPVRFPTSDSATEAESRLAQLTCDTAPEDGATDPEAAADQAGNG